MKGSSGNWFLFSDLAKQNAVNCFQQQSNVFSPQLDVAVVVVV